MGKVSHQSLSATKSPKRVPRGSCWLPCTAGSSSCAPSTGKSCALSTGEASAPAGKENRFKGSMPIFTDQTKSMNLELRDNKSIGSTSTIIGCNGHSHINVILFFSYLAIKTKCYWFTTPYPHASLLKMIFIIYWWQNLTWCNRRIFIIFISHLVGYTHLSLCWFRGSAPPHLEVIYFAVYAPCYLSQI